MSAVVLSSFCLVGLCRQGESLDKSSVGESVSHAYNLEVELYVPTHRGHKLFDAEFLICAFIVVVMLCWSLTCRWVTLALFSDQVLQ